MFYYAYNILKLYNISKKKKEFAFIANFKKRSYQQFNESGGSHKKLLHCVTYQKLNKKKDIAINTT